MGNVLNGFYWVPLYLSIRNIIRQKLEHINLTQYRVLLQSQSLENNQIELFLFKVNRILFQSNRSKCLQKWEIWVCILDTFLAKKHIFYITQLSIVRSIGFVYLATYLSCNWKNVLENNSSSIKLLFQIIYVFKSISAFPLTKYTHNLACIHLFN